MSLGLFVPQKVPSRITPERSEWGNELKAAPAESSPKIEFAGLNLAYAFCAVASYKTAA